MGTHEPADKGWDHMRSTHKDIDVVLVRWPAEESRREYFRALGVPRLLIVEGGSKPPFCGDVKEDWVRPPISRDDLEARVATLRARVRVDRVPEIDPIGVIRYASRSAAISPTEADLLQCLVNCFGDVVRREELEQCLPERSGRSLRNALDLHIMRIRRRIQPLGLVIRTVWGLGYQLELHEA